MRETGRLFLATARTNAPRQSGARAAARQRRVGQYDCSGRRSAHERVGAPEMVRLFNVISWINLYLFVSITNLEVSDLLRTAAAKAAELRQTHPIPGAT